MFACLRRAVVVAIAVVAVVPAAARAADPTVSYSQFGHVVSGTVTPQSGLKATVQLQRLGGAVATAPTTTVSSSGAFTADFGASHGIADYNDTLVISFSGVASPPPTETLHYLYASGTTWPLLPENDGSYPSVSADGKTVTVRCGACTGAAVTVTRASGSSGSKAMTCGGTNQTCSTTVSTPIVPNDTVTVTSTIGAPAGSGTAQIKVTQPASLPGATTIPRCYAYVVGRYISCYYLQTYHRYRVARPGSATVAAFTDASGTFSAYPSDLQPGDAVRVVEGSSGSGRTVATINVVPLVLRVSKSPTAQHATATCAKGLAVGSSANVLCPASQSVAFPDPFYGSGYEYDDRTNSQTIVYPAAPYAYDPADGTTITGPSHLFRVSSYYGTQLASVSARLTGPGGAVISVPSIDIDNGTTVNGLTNGAWSARFTSTDVNSDQTVYYEDFTVAST